MELCAGGKSYGGVKPIERVRLAILFCGAFALGAALLLPQPRNAGKRFGIGGKKDGSYGRSVGGDEQGRVIQGVSFTIEACADLSTDDISRRFEGQHRDLG